MVRLKKDLEGHCRTKVTVWVLVWCLILNTSLPAVFALDPGDMGVNSGVISTTFGPHTVIDTDHGAIINWNNFDTGAAEIIEFNQFLDGVEDSASAVLNRITSAIPTQFDGTLEANGRVFVVNPAGIVFNIGSTVNVGQLVASGLNMTDDAFNAVLANPANQMEFEGGTGEVDVGARVTADRVYLVGKKVFNRKMINATGGLAVLAAGDNVYLAQDGSNVLIQILADPLDTDPDVVNRSVLTAGANGTIVLAAGDTFSRAISTAGAISTASGTVKYQAAKVEISGEVDVSGNPAQAADGGTVVVKGKEEVLLTIPASLVPREVKADGGLDGDGGTITLESEGTVTVLEGRSISASGGSSSGDGGSVKITGEHFVLSGDVDASPQNADYEPGTFEIDPPTVAVANGANPGATALADTLYEQDIETLSTTGTNVIVRGDAVNVEDMTNDGAIAGGVGGIELHGTGVDGSVSFADTGNTVSTTRGDIAVTAGSGGANVGNLRTGAASSSPGQISVATTNGGDVTTGSLTITDGRGRAEINVDASGDLTVNGAVEVGSSTAIDNVPSGQNAEAMIALRGGGNVALNGVVNADAVAANPAAPGGVTKADIHISAGDDVDINGAIVATAVSAANGTSYASVEIGASNNVNFGAGVPAPVADGDSGQVHVQSYTTITETNPPDGDVARIIINEAIIQALPDFGETHMGDPLSGNVLTNDTDPGGDPITAALNSGPSNAASFTLNGDGSYSYTPNPGYVGDDTFTYTATAGGDTTDPVLVTVTMTNTLPVLNNDTATTRQATNVDGNVLTNDLDADGDPLTAALVSGPANAESFTLNADGSFSYKPARAFIGEDSFTYSASDPEIGAVPGQATVTITVNEPGVAPPPTDNESTVAPPPAPGVDVRAEPEISDFPALTKWVSEELGIDQRLVDVQVADALASAREIPPYDAYSSFKKAASILQDRRGIHADALAQVMSEFASSAAPPTEEQMASIAEAIARNTKTGNVYALAGSYLDSLSRYVAFLVSEMGFSEEDAAQFVTTKYIDKLADKDNVGVAAYVAARLATVYEDSID